MPLPKLHEKIHLEGRETIRCGDGHMGVAAATVLTVLVVVSCMVVMVISARAGFLVVVFAARAMLVMLMHVVFPFV